MIIKVLPLYSESANRNRRNQILSGSYQMFVNRCNKSVSSVNTWLLSYLFTRAGYILEYVSLSKDKKIMNILLSLWGIHVVQNGCQFVFWLNKSFTRIYVVLLVYILLNTSFYGQNVIIIASWFDASGIHEVHTDYRFFIKLNRMSGLVYTVQMYNRNCQ